MSEEKQMVPRRKGGRPQKPIRQDQFIGVKCTRIEKILLQQKATTCGTSLSEYLRETGLKGQAISVKKAIPKELLLFTGTLNHLAANLNQVAKKRNSFDILNALERAELNVLSAQVKQLAMDIKKILL